MISKGTRKLYLESMKLLDVRETTNIKGEVEMDGGKFRLQVTQTSFAKLME